MEIRYSMLKDWLDCPVHFYDRYILGKIETKKSSALEYGSALHLGLRTMLNGEDGAPAFNMYWDTLREANMTYYGQSWGELKELAVDHFLPNFKSRHLKKFTEFEQEVKMEMPFLDGHTLQGTADYIGNYEGKLTIADWKTSSKKYRSNKIQLNPQLYIYAKLHQHTTGKLPEQVMYKVFDKKSGNIQTLVNQLTEDYLNSTLQLIEHSCRAMIRAVETKELWHGPDCYCERV